MNNKLFFLLVFVIVVFYLLSYNENFSGNIDNTKPYILYYNKIPLFFDANSNILSFKNTTPNMMFYSYSPSETLPTGLPTDIITNIPLQFYYLDSENKNTKYVIYAENIDKHYNAIISYAINLFDKKGNAKLGYTNATNYPINTIYYNTGNSDSNPCVYYIFDNKKYYLCVDKNNNIYWDLEYKNAALITN
jgi:hypothetical protein